MRVREACSRYTLGVKTAVSIPDDLFKEAERAAEESGMTRSGFYVRALRLLLRTAAESDVEARLNAVYANDPGHLDAGLEALMFSSLSDDDWPEEVRNDDAATIPDQAV